MENLVFVTQGKTSWAATILERKRCESLVLFSDSQRKQWVTNDHIEKMGESYGCRRNRRQQSVRRTRRRRVAPKINASSSSVEESTSMEAEDATESGLKKRKKEQEEDSCSKEALPCHEEDPTLVEKPAERRVMDATPPRRMTSRSNPTVAISSMVNRNDEETSMVTENLVSEKETAFAEAHSHSKVDVLEKLDEEDMNTGEPAQLTPTTATTAPQKMCPVNSATPEREDEEKCVALGERVSVGEELHPLPIDFNESNQHQPASLDVKESDNRQSDGGPAQSLVSKIVKTEAPGVHVNSEFSGEPHSKDKSEFACNVGADPFLKSEKILSPLEPLHYAPRVSQEEPLHYAPRMYQEEPLCYAPRVSQEFQGTPSFDSSLRQDSTSSSHLISRYETPPIYPWNTAPVVSQQAQSPCFSGWTGRSNDGMGTSLRQFGSPEPLYNVNSLARGQGLWQQTVSNFSPLGTQPQHMLYTRMLLEQQAQQQLLEAQMLLANLTNQRAPVFLEGSSVVQDRGTRGTFGHGGEHLMPRFLDPMNGQLNPVFAAPDSKNLGEARTKLNEEPKRVRRSLTAFNFFFLYETERIAEGGERPYDTSEEKKRELLAHCGADKKPRVDLKFKFPNLAQIISDRWSRLPPDVKAFFQDVADEDENNARHEIEKMLQEV